MSNINKEALKSGVWYTISNFLVKGIVFVTGPVFIRLLTKEEYGYFSTYTSWLSIFTILATLDLCTSIQRAIIDYKNEIDQYLSSILLLGSSITLISYLIILCFQDFFINLFQLDMRYINVMFAYILVLPALDLLNTKHRFQFKYKLVATLSIASVILSTITSIILVLIMDDSLWGRILGNSGVLTILNLVLYIYILYKGKTFKFSYCRYALSISIPLVFHHLGGILLSSSDRILIMRYCGAEYTSLYSVVYTLSVAITLLQNSLNQAWTPWLFHNLNKKQYDNIKRFSPFLLISFCILSVFIMLLGPEIVYLYAGPDYIASMYLMPPIMMGLVFYFLCSLFVGVETYHKKNVGIAWRTLVAGLCNIVLNIIFIPNFGYIAAAYTTLFTYALLFLLHYLAAKKLKVNQYYNVKLILTISILMVIISMLILIFYQNNTIRYIFIILYSFALFLIVIFKRKHVASVIKYFKKK